MSKRYTYEEVKEIFLNKGYILLSKTYNNCKDKLYFKDEQGFIYTSTFDKFINRSIKGNKTHPSNEYSIHNINLIAKLNNYPSICVSEHYTNASSYLKFKCSCGNEYETIANNFIQGHKIKCDKCTGYNRYDYDSIKSLVESRGYILLTNRADYKGVGVEKLLIQDSDGYKYTAVFNEFIRKKHIIKRARFQKTNIFTIENINLYLARNNVEFICVSNTYENKCSDLLFQCKRCGFIVTSTWDNVNRNDKSTRLHVICPNCDRRTESLHASILKQVFMHVYPDTVIEDKSYRNPVTKAICPTDIVNHRLKIAIEVQSQFHDYADIKVKDHMKKEFWINRGYKFYDPDIRNYSILEMLQLFFKIDEIPEYVNMNLNRSVNLRDIQERLNCGESVIDIASSMNIKPHIIYDSIYSKRLYYPENYIDKSHSPVLQFDLNWNFINEYPTISKAGRDNNISPGNISSSLCDNRTYANGYNWIYKKDIANILRDCRMHIVIYALKLLHSPISA